LQFSSRAPYAAVIGPSPAAGIATPLAAQGQAPDERPLLGEVPSVFSASKYDQPLNEALADVTAAKLWAGWRFTAAIQNLFDASLADPGGPEHRQDRIPQPGRQFWLKVDFAFR